MAKELVSDELWEVIEPLLPPEPPKPQGSALRAILLPDLALGTIQDTKRCGVLHIRQSVLGGYWILRSSR
jgi:transposase